MSYFNHKIIVKAEESGERKGQLAQLSAEDREYFYNFRVELSEAIAVSGKDAAALYGVMESVFSDIWDAHQKGQSAETYFGVSAATLASQIVDQAGMRRETKIMRFVIPIFWVGFSFFLLWATKNVAFFLCFFAYWLLFWAIDEFLPQILLHFYPEKGRKARYRIKNIVLGVLLLAFAIVSFIILKP